MAKKKKKKKFVADYYDYNLLVSIILLTTFGLIMLYSTSAYSAQMDVNIADDMHYFKKQGLISIGALVLALGVSQIDYHTFFRIEFFNIKLVWYLYAISNILLVATHFIGVELNGAKRWIFIGPISFQPAELAKLAVIVTIPYIITRFGKNMKLWRALFFVGFLGAVASLFTYVFTDNLSTAIIIAGITIGILFVVYPKVWPFVAGVGVVIAVAYGVVQYALSLTGTPDSFRLRRIIVWLSPELYSDQGGYQVTQGLYAIGSGGFFGKGLGNSLQKLDYIPEAQNDMIFTIICEELGVFGAILLTLLFIFMLYRLFFIIQNAPDLLGALIVTGIFIHISLQVILNIAVVTGTIPTTGITLPFVSYGGTSIVFLMMEMALALSVSRQIRFRDVVL